MAFWNNLRYFLNPVGLDEAGPDRSGIVALHVFGWAVLVGTVLLLISQTMGLVAGLVNQYPGANEPTFAGIMSLVGLIIWQLAMTVLILFWAGWTKSAWQNEPARGRKNALIISIILGIFGIISFVALIADLVQGRIGYSGWFGPIGIGIRLADVVSSGAILAVLVFAIRAAKSTPEYAE